MNQLRQKLLYAGLEKSQFDQLLPQAWRDNERGLQNYSLLATIVFMGLIIANPLVDDLTASNQVYYIAMALVNALIYLSVRFLAPKRPRLTPPLAYLFMAALYTFSLCLTVLHRDLPSVTTIVLMFAMPFLITDRPIRLVSLTVLVTVALCVVAQTCKTASVAHMDLWNGLSFAVVASVVEVIQQLSRFHSLAQANKITYLSETDLLTGAKNRNRFENAQREYVRQCAQNMVCVYADVNGLHELNNLKGHKAGDAMLQAVARALIDCFGADHTYRIGGDEFVSLCADRPEEDVRRNVNGIIEALKIKGYNISVGIAGAAKQDLDMALLTTEAENAMYLAKRAYYQQAGVDRRRR